MKIFPCGDVMTRRVIDQIQLDRESALFGLCVKRVAEGLAAFWAHTDARSSIG